MDNITGLSSNHWSGATVCERQAVMNSIFIKHDRFNDAFNFIKRRHYPVDGGLPDHGSLAVLIGESRAGKTAVAHMYAKEHTPSVGKVGMIYPVLYVSISIEGYRALLSEIANALGLKFSLRINNPTLQSMIFQALIDQKVELLIFDEVNTIIADGNRRTTSSTLNLFRKIVDQCQLNILCIGLEETYNILVEDPQITGRGGLHCHVVKPYSWNSPEEQTFFRLLCDEFDRRLPFDQRSKLASPWVAHRLFWSSRGGIVGRLNNFIFDAGCLAINDGAEAITVGHFAQVYEDMKAPGEVFNPWTCEDMSKAPKLGGKNRFDGRSPRDTFSKS